MQGLNLPKNKTRLLTEMRKAAFHVIFQQETHFKMGQILKLWSRDFPSVYHRASPIDLLTDSGSAVTGI